MTSRCNVPLGKRLFIPGSDAFVFDGSKLSAPFDASKNDSSSSIVHVSESTKKIDRALRFIHPRCAAAMRLALRRRVASQRGERLSNATVQQYRFVIPAP